MKNVQLFITRHYDAIKLTLLSICVILLGYIVVTNVEEGREAQERRAESIAQAVKQINDKSDEQTEQLNRQLQALCFIIIQTSGYEALRQIDPPLEEQCRDLTAETKQPPASRVQSTPMQQSTPQTFSGTNDTPRPSVAQPNPSEPPAEPEAQTPQDEPQDEPRGIVPSLINRATDTLTNLLGGE